MGWAISGGIVLLGLVSCITQFVHGNFDGMIILVLFIWVVLAVIWGKIFTYCSGKKKEPVHERVQPRVLKTVEIPKDAHDAVSRFAWLCNQTRHWLKSMGSLQNEYYSNASVRFSFGKSDEDTQVSMSFSFDYTMSGKFFEYMGYELGTGLHVVDDDRVTYLSNEVSGLKNWGNMTTKYSETAAQELLGLIELTFCNECPDAYVDVRIANEEGLFVKFKFR